MKIAISGHDSFVCRQFWLKKGYDFVNSSGNFNSETSVIDLGVGKNMVTSINYWLKSFGITDSAHKPTELGDYLFNNKDGKDPFIESLGTVWLLHYMLVKTNKASIYNWFFNEFRRGRVDFTKKQLVAFVKRKLENQSSSINENTILSDIVVFIRSYLKPDYKLKIDVEDDCSNLLTDLELMRSFQSENAEGENVEWYQLENTVRTDLPYNLVLFSILDNETYTNTISFKELLVSANSPGSIFSLNEEGLYDKLKQIASNYKEIILTESAGVREVQFKQKLDKWKILDEYYKN